MMSHRSDSSTMLNTFTAPPRGSSSSASVLNVGITDGDVWMNATCLTMLRRSLLDHSEEIDRPDLPALERDFDTVRGRVRRGDAAEWRAARQLADHLERLD